MQGITELVKEKAKELLSSGKAQRVLGWQKGEFMYDQTPQSFSKVEELDNFVYDCFSAPNLSKYLISESQKEGVTAVFLKPCDTYSFNQLLKEFRVKREKVYVVGVQCNGKLNYEKLTAAAGDRISEVLSDGLTVEVKTASGKVEKFDRKDVLFDKCLACKGKEHKAYDELLLSGEQLDVRGEDKFKAVERLEKMTADERFEFWRNELSKCIRCNACRNVCPACSCLKCVFDNNASPVAAKANSDSFEENMFHIIRAFHVAGRCTDCGECARVCPQHIHLELLNRKFIKDIDDFYGNFVAGEVPEGRHPLISYEKSDVEPSVVTDKGGEK